MMTFGIRGTSVKQIAQLAGVSQMTVYRRWPRKADIVRALAAREIGRT